tara:strand:- start:1408 stop:1662 length:255 start_codon:yes stop_codon:yes gene_type:complete
MSKPNNLIPLHPNNLKVSLLDNHKELQRWIKHKELQLEGLEICYRDEEGYASLLKGTKKCLAIAEERINHYQAECEVLERILAK